MARFHYKAYDNSGVLETGEVEAPSRAAALDSLFRRGLFPLEAGEGSDAGPQLRWWEREVFGPARMSQSALALLTRELATLLLAHLPLDEALRIVALQPMARGRTRALIERVLGRVLDGASLSRALTAEQGMFPAYYCSMIEAGEASGRLGQVLDNLASLLERSAELRGRIGSALVYPAILMLAALAAVGVILTVLLPTLVPLFKDAGTAPPLPVRMMLEAQDWVAGNWPLVLVATGLLAMALLAARGNASLRYGRDRLFLRLPVVAGLVERLETARFARTLAILIDSGVPMLDALAIVQAVAGNRLYAAALAEAAREIGEGAGLSRSLAQSGLLSELTIRLIAAGERTGEVVPMLLQVAGIQEAQLQRQIERLTTLLTPVLTLVIGLMVGGLILSVIGAIAGINDLAFK